MDSTNLEQAVREEIEELHKFFVSWFSGSAPSTDEYFDHNFTNRFDPQFVLIPPAGITLKLVDLSETVHAAHGSNPDFRIAIRKATVRRHWDNHMLATYEEWQRNALASTPPDNGRVATVLFRISKKLTWLHIHETWLPEDIMAAGPYDF